MVFLKRLLPLLLVASMAAADVQPEVFKAKDIDRMNSVMGDFNARSKAVIEDNASKSVKIRFVSYNWGLLNLAFINVPEYEDRSAPEQIASVLEKLIVDHQANVISLQEVWDLVDFKKIEVALEKLNHAKGTHYKAYKDAVTPLVATGLMVILDQSLVNNPNEIEFKFTEYKNGETSIRSTTERFGGKLRGLLSSVLTLKGNQRMLVGDTHLTALTSSNAIRAEQIVRMRAMIKETENKFDFFALGCDLNFSPEFQQALANEQRAWQENADLFVKFFDEMNFIDGFRVANPLSEKIGYTWQRGLNPLITGGLAAVANEPEQRTDVILLGTSKEWKNENAFIHVLFSDVILKEPLINPVTKEVLLGKKVKAYPMTAAGLYDFKAAPTEFYAPFPASDHFAVIVEAEFFIR